MNDEIFRMMRTDKLCCRLKKSSQGLFKTKFCELLYIVVRAFHCWIIVLLFGTAHSKINKVPYETSENTMVCNIHVVMVELSAC